jgi:hypothetical protein
MDIILPDNVGILPLSPSSRKNPDGPHLLKRRPGRVDSAAVLLIGSQMVAASSTCQCGGYRPWLTRNDGVAQPSTSGPD